MTGVQTCALPIYNSKEAWIKFEVSGRYANAKALKNLPSKFERDLGVDDKYVIRMKKRFNWDIHKNYSSMWDNKRLLKIYWSPETQEKVINSFE